MDELEISLDFVIQSTNEALLLVIVVCGPRYSPSAWSSD